jgi:hypothetical protein
MPPAGIWIDGLIQSCIYMTMAFGMATDLGKQGVYLNISGENR